MKTIRMKKADWEKWDAALRSGEYGQCDAVLADGVGNYCCLGVLQKCLDGETEAIHDEIPSRNWLEKHGIAFDSTGFHFTETGKNRAPALILSDGTRILATDANDAFDDEGGHMYDFVVIADAIKEAVEFTDA